MSRNLERQWCLYFINYFSCVVIPIWLCASEPHFPTSTRIHVWNTNWTSNVLVSTRAPLRGAYSAPPLSNIRDNFTTTHDIATKHSVPYRTSIWRIVWKFCQIRLEFFWENGVSVTSCHAILSQKWSSAISIADQCLMKQIANKRSQNKGNWVLYKMVISDFQIFWIFTPK